MRRILFMINLICVIGISLSAPSIGKGASASEYERRADSYMEKHRYRLAAASYKIALKYAPENKELWEKHRQAIEAGKAIEEYVQRGKEMLEKGYIEDAGNLFREAVKLEPRNETLWRLYENTIVQNPHTVVIKSERDAWMAFKKGRSNFDAGHYEAARRIFEKVAEKSSDEKLLYYARDYLNRTDEKLRDFYPNMKQRSFHP